MSGKIFNDSVDQQHYEDSLLAVSSLTTIVCTGEAEYFVNLKVVKHEGDLKSVSNESRASPSLKCSKIKIVCWNEAMYVITLNYHELKVLKETSGFEGDWLSFINTLAKAIKKIEGGAVEIIEFKPEAEKVTIKKGTKALKATEKFEQATCPASEGLILTFLHPLSEDLKIRTRIKLLSEIPKTDVRYTAIIKSMFKEVYLENAKLNKDLSNANTTINTIKSREHEVVDSSYNLPDKANNKNNKKRKFHSDLINPNAKKRKHQGVKFIEEDEESEQSNSV